MVKRRSSITSLKNILTKQEYFDYQMRQKVEARDKFDKARIAQDKKRIAQEKKDRYSKSTAGKIGKGFSSVIGVARRGVTASLYGQSSDNNIRRPTKSGGGRGRPKGTVKYRDPRTGQPIGVYEYRKIQSQLRWKERQQIMERSVTNPRQREILNAIRARDESRMQSPERRTFPDTTGNIPTMRTIHSEINRYANLVD
jgi:hypothetical protein